MHEIVCVPTTYGPLWLGVEFYPAPAHDKGDAVNVLWAQLGYKGAHLSVEEITAFIAHDSNVESLADAARSHWDARMVDA
jgi:hypothetical protein